MLGIDPGLTRCGYAVLHSRGAVTAPLAMGVIRTPPSSALPQRLAELQRELRSLIVEFGPDAEDLDCDPIPGFLLDMVEAGGLLSQLKKRLEKK